MKKGSLKPSGYTRTATGMLTLALAGLWSGVAFAVADVSIEIPNAQSATNAATVTLTAPDGTTQTATDDDRDGIILLTPSGDAGVYRLAVTLDGRSETRSISVPESGTISVAFARLANVGRGMSIMDEIFVTAQKREENLQRVPVSVTAFTGEAIQSFNFTNSVDIAAQTPGLNIGTPVGEGNNPSITLRGVGLNDFNDNNEAPVAIYVDEVYLASLIGQTFQLFDIERVEVLRGPQGTLYGRNSTGGLVKFVTVKPQDELEFFTNFTYGSYNQIKVEGALNVPLGERVQARASFAVNNADGYVENRFADRPDANDADNYAVRLQLNVDLMDNLNILFNAHGAEADQLAAAYQHQGTGLTLGGDPCATEQALAGECTDFFGYRDDDGDVFAGEFDRTGPLQIENYGVSGTINWTMPWATLTSVTAWETFEKFHQEDTDMGPLRLVMPTFQVDAHQISQELRLSGESSLLRWVAGFYYFEQELDMPQDLFFGPDLVPDGSFLLDTDAHQETESWSLFGQVDFNLTETLILQAGFRWTEDEKTYDYQQVDRFGGVSETGIENLVLLSINPAQDGDDAIFDEGIWSGKAGLTWQPNEDIMTFFSVARGFKSGGFNAGFVSVDSNSQIKYNEETLTSYELGFKSTLLDGLVRLNATGFIYDYNDLQALTFSGQIAAFITNAADASIVGGEIELIANPAEGFETQLGVSLLDTDADQITLPDGSLIDDRKLVLAPEVSLNGLARYTVPALSGMLASQVSFSYQSEHFFDIFNQELAREDGYVVVDFNVAYTFPDDRFQLSVWGKNIFNEEYLVYTFDFSSGFGFNQQFFGRPQWFGATLSFRG